jgi:hypothetical protein
LARACIIRGAAVDPHWIEVIWGVAKYLASG